MDNNTVERIKKLLSLATSDNANERDAALAKAQRIAAENNVDMALLDLSDVGRVKEEEMLDDEVDVGRRLDPRVKFISVIVRDFCNVDLVFGRAGYNRTVNFFGRKGDVSYAKWLFGYLNDEYMRRWNMERKLHNLPGGHRNTFFLGVKNGQHAKLRDEKEAAEAAALNRHASASGVDEAVVSSKREEYRGKFQLATVNEKTLRQKLVRDKYPSLRTAYTRVSIRSHDTYASGQAHGRSMTMNRPLN